MARIRAALLLALALSGCGDWPDLSGSVSAEGRDTDYPTLAPTDDLLSAPAEAGDAEIAAEADTLRARAAALRARAEAVQDTPAGL